eukprot:scaffold45218_cov61-Phaeocystis_antarctica.AAC.9
MNHLKREQPRMATIRAERVLESRARFDPAFSVLDDPPVAALHALSLWRNWVGPAPLSTRARVPVPVPAPRRPAHRPRGGASRHSPPGCPRAQCRPRRVVHAAACPPAASRTASRRTPPAAGSAVRAARRWSGGHAAPAMVNAAIVNVAIVSRSRYVLVRWSRSTCLYDSSYMRHSKYSHSKYSTCLYDSSYIRHGLSPESERVRLGAFGAVSGAPAPASTPSICHSK